MKKLLFALVAAMVLCGPVLADQRKPLVLKNGQLQQVQAGDTVDGSQVTNLPLGTAVTGTLPIANLPTGTSGTTVPLLSGVNTWSGAQTMLGQSLSDPSGGQFTQTYLKSISTIFSNQLGSNLAITGAVVNTNNTAVSYPTGVTGYGAVNATGAEAYGGNFVADCLKRGICSNELDANNMVEAPPISYPPNYTFPLAKTYSQGLYLGAGGSYPSYFAVGIGENGWNPQSWNAGIYMFPGKVNLYGILIDANTTGGPQYSTYSKNVGTTGNINAVFQTTGSYNENGSVLSVQDAGATPHFSVIQSGAVHINDASTSDTGAIVVAAAGNTNGAGIQFTGNGTTTPNKYLRVINGAMQVLNSSYTTNIFNLDDTGNAAPTGGGSLDLPVYCNGSGWTIH